MYECCYLPFLLNTPIETLIFFLILKKEPSDKSSNFLSRLLKILFEVKYLLFL